MKNGTQEGRETRANDLRRARRTVAAAAAGILLSATLSFGQFVESRGVWGFSLGELYPSGAFAENARRGGAGFGFFFAKRLGRSPVFAGGEFSFHFYGDTHRHESMAGIGVPEVQLDVETFNNILQGLFLLRVEPLRGGVKPYAEALAGVSYLYTDTSVYSHTFPWEDLAYDINYDSFTVTAGVGAGLALRVGRPRDRPEHRRKESLIEIKVRYMAGGVAKYLRQGSIVVEGDTFTYQVEKSATSFVTVQMGFSFFF